MSVSQTTLRRLAAAALVLVLSIPPTALAQDTPTKQTPQNAAGGCAAFKWPLDKERQAFDDAGIEQVASGAARGGLKEQAFVLALHPDTDVPYTLPPARRKKEADSPRFGGILAFSAPEKPGTYQVTLSGEGWIDLIQQGASLKAADHSGVRDCPGLRKSVRFAVDSIPVVLQISGVPEQSIKVAIRPAD